MHQALLCLAWVPYSPFSRALERKGYYHWDADVRWQNTSSFRLSDVLLLWPRRDSAIRWALHPGFCDTLLPLFPEARMSALVGGVGKIDCADLRAVIKSSIDTWSMNHPQLHFHDDTDRCANDRLATLADPSADPSVDSRFCDVEINLDVLHMDGENRGRAAFVQLDLVDVDWTVETTAGDFQTGIGLKRGEIYVSLDMCWYLDATFCSLFHVMPPVGHELVRVCVVVVVVVCASTLIDYMIGMTYATIGKERPHYLFPSSFAMPRVDRTGCESRMVRMSAYAAYLPLFVVLICTFILIFLPIFYLYVYIPCAECYDFEATLAHEWGHVLGFQHPDKFDTMNLQLTTAMNASVCHRPFDHVALTGPPADRMSIMHSLAQHSPRTCLTEDDMQGLHTLYPRCETTVAPQCIKSRRYDGIIRLMISVLIPYISVTTLILLLQRMARRYYSRRVARLSFENKALRRVNIRQKIAGQWARAAHRTSMQEKRRFPWTPRRAPSSLRFKPTAKPISKANFAPNPGATPATMPRIGGAMDRLAGRLTGCLSNRTTGHSDGNTPRPDPKSRPPRLRPRKHPPRDAPRDLSQDAPPILSLDGPATRSRLPHGHRAGQRLGIGGHLAKGAHVLQRV